jgi:hypothetical protein
VATCALSGSVEASGKMDVPMFGSFEFHVSVHVIIIFRASNSVS